MVYVPAGLHRAMRMAALSEGRSASDVYVEAARDFLTSRGVAIHDGPGHADPASAQPMKMADLVAAVDRLGRRMDGIYDPGPEHPPAPPREAGTKAAEAMKVLLGILRDVGPVGLSGGELSQAMHGAGVTSGAAETAKAVLRSAGIIRYEERRWIIDRA